MKISYKYFRKSHSFLMIFIITILQFSCTVNADERITCEEVNYECPDGLVCWDEFCVNPREEPCEGIECREDQICYQGTCFWPFSCEFNTCPDGFICDDGLGCIEDLCADVICREGFTCYQGDCFKLMVYNECDDISCPEGSLCYLGNCYEPNIDWENPCSGIICKEGEICYDGSCFLTDIDVKPDNCFPITCPFGWVCDNGKCKPLDPRWHEAINLGLNWFVVDGIALDKKGNPLLGVDIFVQNKLTPIKTNDKGQFSIPIQEDQLLKFTYKNQDDLQLKATPKMNNLLVQFKESKVQ